MSTYYKDQNKKNYKFILIVLFVLIFILFLLVLAVISIKSSEENDNVQLSFDNLKTVKEVIEYYGSEYISEEISQNTNLYMDYYLILKYLPYNEDETSNEEYYNNLLNTSAKVLGYRSFSMIDNENDIKIEVFCDNGKISKILINDIEDYFIYMDSQISLKYFEELPITELSVESSILKECMDKNWDSDIYFGERDSIYDEYYIYLDEGIKSRIINNQIYNIVFDENYEESVVNGIFPGMDLKDIEMVLGEPTFENDDSAIIGYKGEKIYVFFSEGEISIYRNLDIDTDDFFELVDEYLNDNIDFLEFMNQLTYLWPDYSEYAYTSNSVFIAYPSKGIEIKLNYDDISGILVYNNIKSSLTKVGRYLENTDFISRLKIDATFEAEQRRVNKTETDKTKCEEYRDSWTDEEKEIRGESLDYDIYAETDTSGYIYSMKFISKDNKHANREVNDSITSYLWISSDYFAYSKEKKGIYLVNLNNGNVTRLLSGDETYELKGFENNILKYDSKQLLLEY